MQHRVNPNDPCPCGSGRKFKRCCMSLERRRSFEDLIDPMKQPLGEIAVNGEVQPGNTLEEFMATIPKFLEKLMVDPEAKCNNCGGKPVVAAGVVMPYGNNPEKLKEFSDKTGQIHAAAYGTCAECEKIPGIHDTIRDRLLEQMGVDPSSDN